MTVAGLYFSRGAMSKAGSQEKDFLIANRMAVIFNLSLAETSDFLLS